MTRAAQEIEKKIRQIEKEKREIIRKNRKKTAGELYSLSQKVLEDPALLRIVLNAPVKKDGHINFTAVYNTAFDYVYGKTEKDLQKSKELAVATRWAAKFKDDYPTEFETEILEAKIKTTLVLPAEKSVHSIEELKSEPKPEPKDVKIPLSGDILNSYHGTGQIFPFLVIQGKKLASHDVVEMVGKLLQAITAIEFPEHTGCIPEIRLCDYLIKILEEKFGLAIRICGNCKSRSFGGICTDKSPKSRTKFSYSSLPCREFFDSCSNFKPKEIPPEKKEEEKTCGNCALWHARMIVGDTTYCGISNGQPSRIITSLTPACDIWKIR